MNSENIKIKICGLTQAKDVRAAVDAGANAIGFVLYKKSPRYIPIEKAAELAALLPPMVVPVLLFVNAEKEEVLQAAKLIKGAILQFHGDEDPAYCQSIAKQSGHSYWRALRIPNNAEKAPDFSNWQNIDTPPQALLLDSYSEGYGGSGHSFNWEVLPEKINSHLILSGGLNAQNISQAIKALQKRGLSLALDVSSAVEVQNEDGAPLKGIKDERKIKEFINAARTVKI